MINPSIDPHGRRPSSALSGAPGEARACPALSETEAQELPSAADYVPPKSRMSFAQAARGTYATSSIASAVDAPRASMRGGGMAERSLVVKEDNKRRVMAMKKGSVELWRDNSWGTKLLKFGIISNVVVDDYIVRKMRKAKKIGWRDQVYQFLYSPSSTVSALAFAIFTMACVLASAVLVAMHSIPPWDQGNDDALLATEYALSAVFILEVLLRFVSCPSWRVFALDLTLWVDVVCLVPLYVRAVHYPRPLSDADASIRLLVRLTEALGPLRLLKLYRWVHNVALLLDAVLGSLEALLVPLFFLFLLVTSGGSLIYAFEQQAADASDYAPEFRGVNNVLSAWINVATLTTIGYVFPGFEPQTVGGMLMMACVGFGGLLVVAMALQIVGSRFGNVWDSRQLALVQAGMKRMMVRAPSTRPHSPRPPHKLHGRLHSSV